MMRHFQGMFTVRLVAAHTQVSAPRQAATEWLNPQPFCRVKQNRGEGMRRSSREPQAWVLTTDMHCSFVAPGVEFQNVLTSSILQLHIYTLCGTRHQLNKAAAQKEPLQALCDGGLQDEA